MGNEYLREPRIKQETKPSFRNEFHRYDHYLGYAIDSYNLKSEKLAEASVIKEQTKHHHTYGFQARTYETKDEMIVAVRGTEMSKWRDLLTDGKLALGGHPKGQIEQLIKFFEEKNANGKSLIEQLIEAKKQGKHIVITGHSLGGYLAQVATQIYPDVFNEYYGYQAPSANFKEFSEIVEKNGKYYERIPSQFEIGNKKYTDSLLPDDLGRGLFQLQESIANKTSKTNFFDIRADTDWAVIANLHNRERFGDLIKVAGENHSSLALSKILRLYDTARHLGMKDVEKNVTGTLEKIYRTTGMPVSEIADNLIKEIGRQKGLDINDGAEKIYNELAKEPRSMAMRDLTFQNVDKSIERLPLTMRDVSKRQDQYRINFSKIVGFGENNQNNRNFQNYQMTQSDYQNMVNGFESMSIK